MIEEPRVQAVERLDLPAFSEGTGSLVVAELPIAFGFKANRVFLVTDVPKGGVRGHHAHRTCTQVFVCIAGEIEVTVDDGATSRSEILDSPRIALFVPPMTWTHQVFRYSGSTLLVLADEPYDEAEYIRSRDEFDRLAADGSTSGASRRR